MKKKSKEIFLSRVQRMAQEYDISEFLILVNDKKVEEMDNVLNFHNAYGSKSSGSSFDISDEMKFKYVLNRQSITGCSMGGSDMYYGDISKLEKIKK